MASCPKCGRQKVGKDIEGRRRCRKCGILPGMNGMDRSGFPRDASAEKFSATPCHGRLVRDQVQQERREL
jgi:transcription initiation factor TFIIIB Brf1 subunit/transcription initiation factor TFIIB